MYIYAFSDMIYKNKTEETRSKYLPFWWDEVMSCTHEHVIHLL